MYGINMAVMRQVKLYTVGQPAGQKNGNGKGDHATTAPPPLKIPSSEFEGEDTQRSLMHVIVVEALGSSTTASESRTCWLVTRLLNVPLCRWTVGRHECRLDVLSRLVLVRRRAFSRGVVFDRNVCDRRRRRPPVGWRRTMEDLELVEVRDEQ